MSTTANRTRGAVPTRMAAAIAALSLLAMPVPAGAQGSGRTVLLTLTDGVSLSQLADTVGALGGRVLATLELSDSLLVELPKGVGAPAGSAEIPDTPMKVNGTQQYYDTEVPTYRETIGLDAGSNLGEGVTVALVDTGVAKADGLSDANVEHVNVSGGEQGDGLGHGTFLAGLIAGRRPVQGRGPRRGTAGRPGRRRRGQYLAEQGPAAGLTLLRIAIACDAQTSVEPEPLD